MFLFSQINSHRDALQCVSVTGFGTIFAERERERETRRFIKRNPPRFFDGHTLTSYRIFFLTAALHLGSAAVFFILIFNDSKIQLFN